MYQVVAGILQKSSSMEAGWSSSDARTSKINFNSPWDRTSAQLGYLLSFQALSRDGTSLVSDVRANQLLIEFRHHGRIHNPRTFSFQK